MRVGVEEKTACRGEETTTGTIRIAPHNLADVIEAVGSGPRDTKIRRDWRQPKATHVVSTIVDSHHLARIIDPRRSGIHPLVLGDIDGGHNGEGATEHQAVRG